MKVAYINPAYGKDFVRSARWAARSRGRVQRHPEQALTQIAVLEAAGHECRFIEGAALNLSESSIRAELKTFKPDMVVVHTTTPSIYSDLEYARMAKEVCDCSTVMVGAHAGAEPENTLVLGNGDVDAVIRGEVEYTLRDLADKIPFDDILGISYVAGNKVVHNDSRPYLDVNELPFPAWNHIDPHWYHDAGKLYPFLTLYTGRGCFGLCSFCRETQVVHGRTLRMRDPKLVVDEMDYDLGLFPFVREIMFETDTFTAVPSHVEKVCNEIMLRGLHSKVSWSCNVRVDIKLDLLPIMKNAGCRMLMVGFEFGSDEQLNSVKKGTTVEMARKFAKRAHELGFVIHGCFMIGAPGETRESAQSTIDFAKSLPLDTVQFSGVVAYPGTEFYSWAKKNDFLTAKDWNEWVNDDHEQVTLLSYPQLSKQEIDFYIDKGLKEFYLRPSQVLRMLMAIRNWDDIRRKFYGLSSFLDYFARFRKRNNENSSCSCRTQ